MAVRPARGSTAPLVPSAAVADQAIVLVGDRLLLVPLAANVTRSRTSRSMPLADVTHPGRCGRAGHRAAAVDAAFDAALDDWLALTAAALVGIAAQALEIGVEYVKERKAWGVPIGSFQAISHRLADSAAAIDGARLLAYEAAWADDEDRGTVRRAGRDGLRVRLRDGPRRHLPEPPLPRRLRLHDGVRHPALLPAGPGVDQRLRRVPTSPTAGWPTVATGRSGPLMDFRLGTEAEDDPGRHPRVPRGVHDPGAGGAPLPHRGVARSRSSPTRSPSGGGSRPPGPRSTAAAARTLGSSCRCRRSTASSTRRPMRRASPPWWPRRSARWAPRSRSGRSSRRPSAGEIIIVLGFTEPEAGSDVANAQTKAVRDGDEWVINGQKMFTTNGHIADYVFLLTRTNPDVAKHKGLTMFLVPMDQPGRRVPGRVHAVRRAHEHHLLQRRARARRLPHRRGRRRLERDDGGRSRTSTPVATAHRMRRLHPRRRGVGRRRRRRRRQPTGIDDPDVRGRMGRFAAETEVSILLQRRANWMAVGGDGPGGRRVDDEALQLRGALPRAPRTSPT